VKKLGEYSAIVNSGALTTCVSNVSHRNGFQSSTFVSTESLIARVQNDFCTRGRLISVSRCSQGDESGAVRDGVQHCKFLFALS
jgi:hypothetical protein